MKRWAILKDNVLYGPVSTSGFRPNEPSAFPWPEGAEDVRDLKLETVTDEMGQEIQQVVIDEALKAARILEDEAKATAQAELKAKQDAINSERKKMDHGLHALALYRSMHVNPALTLEQLQTLSQNTTLTQAKEFLRDGYLEGALTMLQELSASDLMVSEQQRTELLNYISEALV